MITVRTTNNSPVEPFLESVVKEFNFKDDYFKGKNNKEIIEQFYDETNGTELRFDEISVIREVK